MHILIDECVPIAVRGFFSDEHVVATVGYMGWKGLKNGTLLAAAENAHVDVLVTSDANMYKEHDLSGRLLAVAVLPTNHLSVLRSCSSRVVDFVLGAKSGTYCFCSLDWLQSG